MWSKNVGQDPLKIHLNKFIFSLFLNERLKVFNYFSTVAKQLHFQRLSVLLLLLVRHVAMKSFNQSVVSYILSVYSLYLF